MWLEGKRKRNHHFSKISEKCLLKIWENSGNGDIQFLKYSYRILIKSNYLNFLFIIIMLLWINLIFYVKLPLCKEFSIFCVIFLKFHETINIHLNVLFEN